MAGDFKFIGAYTCNQDINVNSTDKQAPLGMIALAQDEGSDNRGVGEFIYLTGLASTAVGEVVVYNASDWSTKLAVANDIGPVATAMSVCVASEYGWYQISGKGVALVAASFADNGDCYLTSTAGTLDDADVAGDLIARMKGASAIAGGIADVEMHRPSVANGNDD
jgi:hypothetical protein